MHPSKAFEWTDRAEMLRFVGERAFAHIFTASDMKLFVVHAPVMVTDAGKIWFHVGRPNRIADHLANGAVLISISGREAYQSASWYASENQVPTWHYEAVEIEGRARQLRNDELVSMLDRLSAKFEHLYSPEAPWSRAKMAPGKFEAMLKAIVGFEVEPIEVRGTRKFNQHKGDKDLAATIDGQERAGRRDIISAIRELSGN